MTSEGASRGPRKKFSRLAIARHIFRPPHKLCNNSTTVHIRGSPPYWICDDVSRVADSLITLVVVTWRPCCSSHKDAPIRSSQLRSGSTVHLEFSSSTTTQLHVTSKFRRDLKTEQSERDCLHNFLNHDHHHQLHLVDFLWSQLCAKFSC